MSRTATLPSSYPSGRWNATIALAIVLAFFFGYLLNIFGTIS